MTYVLRSPLRACIIEAARAGNPPRVIAADLGKPVHKVRKILHEERSAGVELPMFKGTGRPKKERPQQHRGPRSTVTGNDPIPKSDREMSVRSHG